MKYEIQRVDIDYCILHNIPFSMSSVLEDGTILLKRVIPELLGGEE